MRFPSQWPPLVAALVRGEGRACGRMDRTCPARTRESERGCAAGGSTSRFPQTTRLQSDRRLARHGSHRRPQRVTVCPRSRARNRAARSTPTRWPRSSRISSACQCATERLLSMGRATGAPALAPPPRRLPRYKARAHGRSQRAASPAAELMVAILSSHGGAGLARCDRSFRRRVRRGHRGAATCVSVALALATGGARARDLRDHSSGRDLRSSILAYAASQADGRDPSRRRRSALRPARPRADRGRSHRGSPGERRSVISPWGKAEHGSSLPGHTAQRLVSTKAGGLHSALR